MSVEMPLPRVENKINWGSIITVIVVIIGFAVSAGVHAERINTVREVHASDLASIALLNETRYLHLKEELAEIKALLKEKDG